MAFSLYQHQKEGIAFALNRRNERGAMLAFEQGLGKTPTALVFSQLLHKYGWKGVTLIVVPASLIHNWKEEAWRFIGVRPQVYHGRKRKFTNARYVLTSYETLTTDIEKFAEFYSRTPILLVGDEAHAKLQNDESQRTKAVRRLAADFLLLLTGTPISNKPEDLYSLVALIDPALAGDKDLWLSRFTTIETRARKVKGKWGATYMVPFEKIVGYRNLDVLHEMLSEVMLRRTKEGCLDLPKKQVVYLPYELNKTKRAYVNFLDRIDMEEETRGSGLVKLAYILSGVCPDTGHFVKSDKFDVLRTILDGTDKPMIIWCKYKATVDALKSWIMDKPTFVHTGEQTAGQRHQAIQEFKQTPGAVLLATIESGGVGLNLTEAKTSVFYETNYTVSSNEQAEDRIHRIGQDEDVTIYYLYGKNTIEEGIIKLLKEKSHTNKVVITGDHKGRDEIQNYSYSVGTGMNSWAFA